ncbi:MAG: glycine--tRNA ligase subunit beta, partial [Pseudomonadota bacterium]
YAEKLRACHVIVDHKEREGIIRTRADALAEAAGLTRKQDPGLVEENAGLTEWPVPLLGGFDEAFLEVAPEAITLAMRSHQKYFACLKPDGSLSPHFICVANLEPADDGAHVVAGNEKVLAARLSDAKFFWEQDQKMALAEHAKKLDQIVFHEKLGTVADKVDRVAKLARWLVEERIVIPAKAGIQSDGAELDSRLRGNDGVGEAEVAALADKAEQAARLAKADLVTGMVGEFADLQGIMGGYYAANEGLDEEVAAAIRDHYKPVGQGDAVPTAPVTVAVSLADKIDSIVGFFAANEKPTGSKDPFALRRAALGIIQLITKSHLRLSLRKLAMQPIKYLIEQRFYFDMPDDQYADSSDWLKDSAFGGLASIDIPEFFADRLKVQQREAGVRHDLIDAVFALGGEDDLVRLLARVKALQAFLKTADGANLLAGYKRAANILKKEGRGESRAPAKAGAQSDGADEAESVELDSGLRRNTPSYSPEPEEALLREALERAEPEAEAAIEAEDFEGAMAVLATLRKPIDAFFDTVTVNDEDPVKRASRLHMLERMRDAVHRVADFSKIEG